MPFSSLPLLSTLLTCSLLALQAPAQELETVEAQEPATAGTPAWFGRLDDARAEAERTGRPLLLMSAAPQCSGAPGMW